MEQRLEDIIVGRAARGMDRLLPCCPRDAVLSAAREIVSWRRGKVLLTTGFYVGGHPETDGPGGAYALAAALEALSFSPVLVTDDWAVPVFAPLRARIPSLETVPLSADAKEADLSALLSRISPVGLLSVERCGRTERGTYENCRGESISPYTAPCDGLFLLAAEIPLPTIGIGDGGNEIGMGRLAPVIRRELGISPCIVPADHLLVADVSNWGAYALAAALGAVTGLDLLPGKDEVLSLLRAMVALGAVDGFSRLPEEKVDGFPLAVEGEILDRLHDWMANHRPASFSRHSER